MATNNCDIVLLKLDQTVIPNIPFLWYREEQILCPFDHITKQNMYTITQRHVLADANLYICLHSLMYYTINKNGMGEIIDIPNRFNKQLPFKVKINLIEGEMKEVGNGLKLNEFVTGCVFIHGKAFSPPGCFHFKVNNELEKNVFVCDVQCDELQINEKYQFVLINNLKI
jgi:hypothetical protein